MPSASNEEIETRLRERLTPAVFEQLGYYRQLKMRERIHGLDYTRRIAITERNNLETNFRKVDRHIAGKAT